jgi:chromosome partitioning protein
MTKIIAVLNQKGGCGKTTISMNLAAALTQAGQATMLLDADPQQSAMRWAQQGGNLGFAVQPINMEQGARKFKQAIQTLAGNAAMVILDLPPELKEPAMLACMLGDLTLIPIKPSPLDLWAGKAAVDLAKDAQELRQDNGRPWIVLLPSCVKGGTRMSRDIGIALARTGEQVSPVYISERVALAECAMLGETIDRYDASNLSCDEFRQLAKFVMETLERA